MLKDPNIDPGMLQTKKQEYYNAFAQRDAKRGDIEKGRIQVTLNEMAMENKDAIKGSPAMQLGFRYSQQTGDPDLFKDMLKEKIKNEAKGNLNQWETFYSGKLEENIKLNTENKSKGLPFVPFDRVSVAKEFEQLKDTPKPFKVGDIRQVQKGDQNITEEYTATGWKEIGKGPKFKPGAEGSDMAKIGNLRAVGLNLAAKYFPLAKANMGSDADKLSEGLFMTDQFGQNVNESRLRSYLKPNQQAAYDWIKIEAERLSKTETPANAVDMAISTYGKKFGGVTQEATQKPNTEKEKTHPLSGMKAGRYRMNGKEVRWDGTKEI
jgi:hypothetical protein